MPEKQSKVYICLIIMELSSIGIKYQGVPTNPFQKPGPSMLTFLVALICHIVAYFKASLPTTIPFHASGFIAVEALLWIIVHEFWTCFIIINLLLFLVAALSFYYNDICKFLGILLSTCLQCMSKLEPESISNDDPLPDLESQDTVDVLRTNSEL